MKKIIDHWKQQGVMTTKSTSIILILLIALLLLPLWNAKLVMVYQMGRHGYRSSKITKGGLLQDDSLSFRKGSNSLTNQGLRQTFERGRDLVERYPTLFQNIDFSRIKIRSTKSDFRHWRLCLYKFWTFKFKSN